MALQEVRLVHVEHLRRRPRPVRRRAYASPLPTGRYEQARPTVRAFVGARPEDAVIFQGNPTDATNLLAGCLPAGATAVVFDTEHHASLLPWERVVRLAPPAFPG